MIDKLLPDELVRKAREVVAFWDEVDVALTPGLGKLPVGIRWVFGPDDPWVRGKIGPDGDRAVGPVDDG